mgnify:CR=1 FL=1
MSAPEYIRNTQGKLEENKFYDFKILKTTKAPDDILYFIIEDPFGQKHMMEAECYKLYDFEIGDVIQVRIDRINCKGQVFFEPKHPKYNEGEIFSCAYLGQQWKKNKFNEEELFLAIKGPDGEKVLLQTVSQHQEKKGFQVKTIDCKIRKISKGKLRMSQYLD